MEALFKKYFWLINLVFLALCALMIAAAVNNFIVAKVQEKFPVEASAVKAAPASKGRIRNFNVANEANIFGAQREDLSKREAECTEEKPCESGECVDGECVAPEEEGKTDFDRAVKSSLRAKLVGTAVFDEPELSVASIIDYNEGKKSEAGLYSINKCVGDKLPTDDDEDEDEDEEKVEDIGVPINLARRAPCEEFMEVGRMRAITPDRVYFYNTEESQLEYLELGEEPEGGRVSSRKPKKKKKKKTKEDDSGAGIRSKGNGQYEVDQAEVDKALGNLSSLATQARIVPAFEGGKPIGFKLFSIRPNSLYSKIGIQNGDIINRVNGYEINSPDKALELYQKLKDSKSVTVDIKRRGKPKTLDYSIVP